MNLPESNINLTQEFSILRNDLVCAWNHRNDVIQMNGEVVEETDSFNILLNSSNYTSSIDPESMVFLKAIFTATKKNYTLNSLANDIRTGKSFNFVMGF